MKQSNTFALIVIGGFFFLFGFVTWLNAVLIPYLKVVCQLKTDLQAYLVTFAFYIAYFVMAIPSSFVLKKTGFKKGMALGLVVMALGCFTFIPASRTQTFGLFLLGLFIQGIGLTLLQTAANPYVAVLGKPESATQRISIMGIANKIAGILSPIILGAVLFTKDIDIENTQSLTTEQIVEIASKVIIPYLIMGMVLIGLALVILRISLPKIEQSEDPLTISKKAESVLQFRHLVLGVIALFLYVGAEVIAGDTIINYGISLGFDEQKAKFFTSYTLIGMLVGYLVAIITVPRFISQQKILVGAALLGVLLTLGIVFGNKEFSLLSVALLGLANSVMWPAIFSLAIQGLGGHTKTGSALLIMAIAGGAILPLLYGQLSGQFNPQQAYWLLVPCYFFISFYGWQGYKTKDL